MAEKQTTSSPSSAHQLKIDGTFVAVYAPLLRNLLPPDPPPPGPLPIFRLGQHYFPQSNLACFKFSPNGSLEGNIKLNIAGVASTERRTAGSYTLLHNDVLDVIEGDMRVDLFRPDNTFVQTNFVHLTRISHDEMAFMLTGTSVNPNGGDLLVQGIFKRVSP